jgi:hypothetical protein
MLHESEAFAHVEHVYQALHGRLRIRLNEYGQTPSLALIPLFERFQEEFQFLDSPDIYIQRFPHRQVFDPWEMFTSTNPTTNPDVTVGPARRGQVGPFPTYGEGKRYCEEHGIPLASMTSANGGAWWANVDPAPYSPGGSAPPKPWAREVGELADRVDLMHSHLAAVARKLEAFASKPVSGHRAWRDDPANFDYLHDGERMWTRYKGVWAASMADVHSMVVCSFRELKGPELDEILREFANRDKSDATS